MWSAASAEVWSLPFRMNVQHAEKVYQTYVLEVTDRGGHSASGRRDSAIYALAEALRKLSQFEEFLAKHANGVDELRRRAREWSIEAAAREAAIDPDMLVQFVELYASTSPAVIRTGWGLERNRNGG